MEPVLAISALGDGEVAELLRVHKIGLTVAEMRQVAELLGRDPTLTEATVWGIQGSEHCSYKSSRKFLRQFSTQAPHVMVPVGEDSGVFSLFEHVGADGARERYGIIVAHESHNHPSQIVPFEGAATGVGGIVRDVACMGGRVIGTMDGLRFGAIDRLDTRWIAGGVTSGIGGYGNPIGVPNVGGDAYFHPGFNDNCLVNVVAIGRVKESEIIHSYVPDDALERGYEFILVGKATDRSGMGGAAFASASFSGGASGGASSGGSSAVPAVDMEAKKSAVQEPNPFLKRHLLVATYDLFDELRARGWLGKVAFKDLGAGGVVCSSVEMVAKRGFGAMIHLDAVHTAIADLPSAVIGCAETQERFMWCVDPEISDFIVEHYNAKWELPMIATAARASKVGRVCAGNYVLKRGDEVVLDARAADITEGLSYDRPYDPPAPIAIPEDSLHKRDLANLVIEILAHENVASRKPIYERYDKQVQGYVIVERGEASASVMTPYLDEDEAALGDARYTGLVSALAGDPRYGVHSAYWQGANAVVQSMYAVAAVGGVPLALTDCLNYGNPENPKQMSGLVEGIRGINDATRGIRLKDYSGVPTPIVSGNVSLYNEGAHGGIPPSAVVACFGRIDDARRAVTLQFKRPDSRIVLIGERGNERRLPQPDFARCEREIFAMSDLVAADLVLSSCAIGLGGIAVALAKMCLGASGTGHIGATINLARVPGHYSHGATSGGTKSGGATLPDLLKLLSETHGFLLEVDPSQLDALHAACRARNVIAYDIGATTDDPTYRVDGEMPVALSLSHVADAWVNGLRQKLQ